MEKTNPFKKEANWSKKKKKNYNFVVQHGPKNLMNLISNLNFLILLGFTPCLTCINDPFGLRGNRVE